MNKKWILYILRGIFILSLLGELLSSSLSIAQRLLWIGLQILSFMMILYWENFHLYLKKTKIKNDFLIMIFMIYVVHLMIVLFFDQGLGRHADILKDYPSINLQLFATIQLFINGYLKGIVSFQKIFLNLVGNFVIFMPMGYFLPTFLKIEKHFIIYFISISCLVLCVEIIQVYFHVGSGDIDDWLLNVLGAILFYSVFMKYNNERNRL